MLKNRQKLARRCPTLRSTGRCAMKPRSAGSLNVMHLDRLAFLAWATLFIAYAGSSSASSGFESIPVDEVLPIQGKSCGCISFPSTGPLLQTNIVMSSGSYDGPHLIRYEGTTLSFSRAGPPQGKRNFINKYVTGKSTLISRTHEVHYQQVCSTYPDPPAEGSCFAGSLTIRTGEKSATLKIVQLCGC